MQKFQQKNLEHIQEIFSKNGGTFSRAEKAADGLAESCDLGCGASLFFDGDRLCCGKIFFFKGR